MFFLFQRAGLQAEFEQDNITVFASSNSAWDSLPVGVMDYLQSDEVTAFFIPPSILLNIFTSLPSQFTFQLINLPNVFGINFFNFDFQGFFSHHIKRNL